MSNLNTTLKAVFESTFEGKSLTMIATDDSVAEASIVEKFNETAPADSELIMLVVDQVPVYTIRTKISGSVEDEFEYVDNEGNPINEDGTDFLESDNAAAEPYWEIPGNFYWSIEPAEVNAPLTLQEDIYMTMCLESQNPFEDETLIAIVSSK